MNHTLHVVSHTHWDREWYQPFELFRLRLVDLVDRLLDLLEADPDYRFFNLDGQGIILEDYLRIRPENHDRLKRFIEEGRITIGPWYVLNDEFLVSGESTVRSLLLGHKVVEEFGPVMKVGYLPDQFGNISQMPQILRNFGIDNCIFGRGWQAVDERKMEFDWQSPDGSSVLSSLMSFWYNNAQDIPEDGEEGQRWTEAIRDRMAAISGSKHLLLMNGVDHLEAQYNLSRALKNINEKLRGDTIEHSTLPRYVEALRGEVKSGELKPEPFRGELREDRWGSILAGVLSARIYLKQANDRCQRVLEKFAEPASVWAATLPPTSTSGKGLAEKWSAKYPAGELEYAWKLLMENHPHDSICGCSLDEVHDEMMHRFTKVEQLGEALKGRALRHIADRIKTDGQALVVFNALTWDRTDVVEAEINIPLGDPDRFAPQGDASEDWPALEILDENEKSIPYTLISSQKVTRSVWHPEKLPHVQWVRNFQVEFIAEDIPAMGYKTFRLQRADIMPDFGPSLNSMRRDNLFAESGVVDVSPSDSLGYDLALWSEDDTLFLSCLTSLEDVGDVGDEYNYRKPDKDIRILGRAGSGQRRILSEGAASVTMETRSSLRLPESATPDKKARSERSVDCPVSMVARTFKGLDRVEIETTIENNAKDHRLRALFPTEATDAKVSVAGGAYDAIERAVDMTKQWKTSPPPSPFHPMDGWVDVSDGKHGLAVLVDGLKEFELYDDETRTLAITLLRSVGVLAGGGEIPHVQETPGAQCLGKQTARYAVYPHTGDWKAGKVWKHALEYQVRLTPVQIGDIDRSRTIEPVIKDLPESFSFVRISEDAFVPSALKKEENGVGCVLRFFNILEEETTGTITFTNARKVWKSNMAEERLEELKITDGRIDYTARGKEIVTMIFEM